MPLVRHTNDITTDFVVRLSFAFQEDTRKHRDTRGGVKEGETQRLPGEEKSDYR
jgi:hypothetical protein